MPERRISRPQLLGYLDRLSQDQPVPEQRLQQAALQYCLDLDDLLYGARREHVKRDRVRYLGVDQEALRRWQDILATEYGSPRINGAAQGDSHRARVSGAMLTIRSRRQPHPQVVMVDHDGVIASGGAAAPASLAVLVENLENFLDLEGTLGLLPECGIGPEWQEADILYGSGNSITNRLLTPFLQQYQEIGCLFDPDPGGVRMCDTLYQRRDLPPLHFLAPFDLPERLAASPRTINMRQREQLANHMRRSPPCVPVAGLIHQTGRQLEQETYLIPILSSVETPDESGL